MEQNDSPVGNPFDVFLSAYNQANLEDKRRLLAQCYTWSRQADNWAAAPITLLAFAGSEKTGTAQSITIPSGISPEPNLLNLELSQIAQNIEQVFWLIDYQSDRILFVSPTFETVWGRPCADLYTNTLVLIESVHPEDRLQVMVARLNQDRQPFNQVYRILRPDGSLRWISSRTISIKDGPGETSCLFCIAQDITDQKQIELALRKTLDRTREQVDHSHKMSLARKPEAVLKILMSAQELRTAEHAVLLVFTDPDLGPGRGVDLVATWPANLAHASWLGESTFYEEPALWALLKPNRTLVISGIQTDPRLTPLVRDFLLAEQIQTLVIFPMIASGTWIGCVFVYYKQEQIFDHIELRFLRVLMDQAAITLYNLQLLELEEESRHEAESANAIKTEFLAMISHELRTPLTSIIGFTMTLLADDVTWEPIEQHDFIQTIQQEAGRLHELIDHLLDLSRLEAGRLPIVLESTSFHDIIEDALPQFRVLTGEHNLAIHAASNLPAVYVDAKRIAQVLVNLVRNASTYAPKGTEINLSASVRGRYLQINVMDQGPGIPPEERKHVFEAFKRGTHTENGAGKGAGLGLAICKGLIDAHGGRIWIKQHPGPGTTFSFTIPLASHKNPEITPGKN